MTQARTWVGALLCGLLIALVLWGPQQQSLGVARADSTVTTDPLTLDGGGSAVLDGGGCGPTEFEGVVTIDGVQGVTLMVFAIQNSPGQGILGVGGAAFAVKDITVQNNGLEGIFLNNNASAELTDVEVKNSGRLVRNHATCCAMGARSSHSS